MVDAHDQPLLEHGEVFSVAILELDYQVSICSLIPPAKAISKTHECMVEMAIFNILHNLLCSEGNN